MIKLNFSKIKKIVYIYLMLPLVSFLLFYMQSLVGFLAFLVMGAILVFLLKQKKTDEQDFCVTLSIKTIVVLGLVAIIWSFLGGMGGHYYQSGDWNWRNALYRDILYRDWPVVYEDYNKALVYYIGYWLPPASVVKVLVKIFPGLLTSEAVFVIGNQLLWLWTAVGIFFVELLLITFIRPKSDKRALWIPAVLVFFSGLDIVGVIYKILTEGSTFVYLHIEWWIGCLQFSSLTTCLFWVYNQSVILWIVILCVLQEKNVKNYILLGTCALISGPIPFLGVFVYMVSDGIVLLVRSIKAKSWKTFIKDVFSVTNCLSLLLMPVIYLYYKSNGAVSAGASNAGVSIMGIVNLLPISWEYVKQVFWFLFLEVGIYFIIIFRYYRKEPFFYVTVATSCMAPFFSVGTANDFVMRFSIPTIMVLAALCGKCLLGEGTAVAEIGQNKKERVKNEVCRIALCVTLLFGSITPLTEFFRGYNAMLMSGKINNSYDTIRTLNQEFESPELNFVTFDYKEKPFFKYLTNVK